MVGNIKGIIGRLLEQGKMAWCDKKDNISEEDNCGEVDIIGEEGITGDGTSQEHLRL